jgi:hypothetical protein
MVDFIRKNMNIIDRSKYEFHKASDVNLKNIWEDIFISFIPILKLFQKDFSYGRIKRNI